MPEMRFDVATPADRDEVEALLAATYPVLLAPDYPAHVLAAALPAIVRARPALLVSGSYFVARDGAGRALAAGGWTPEPPGGGAPTPGLGHLRHVVTRLDRTGEGIGRALLAHILGHAEKRGMRRLECLSTRTAVPFYRAAGFEGTEEIDVPVGPGAVLPSVRLVRAL